MTTGAMVVLLAHVLCHVYVGDVSLSLCVIFPFLPMLFCLFHTVPVHKTGKTPTFQRKQRKLTESSTTAIIF